MINRPAYIFDLAAWLLRTMRYHPLRLRICEPSRRSDTNIVLKIFLVNILARRCEAEDQTVLGTKICVLHGDVRGEVGCSWRIIQETAQAQLIVKFVT